MNDPRLIGALEYKAVQAVRDMGPSTPSAVVQWVTQRDTVTHAFAALFTTLKRLAEKKYLHVDRRRGATARGSTREMDVYTITPEGERAAIAFEKSIQNFMLPERGE